MTELKKHTTLLLFLITLLTVKFIVVPIMTWQEGLVTEINIKERKLGKITALLAEGNSFNSLNQQVKKRLGGAEQLFFPYQTSSSFKLEQQKFFEDLAEKHQLSLSSFSWQANSEDKALQIIRYQVRIRLKGNVSHIVSFMSALESQQQRVEVHDFNIPMKGQNEHSLGKTKNARFNLRFYVNNQTKEKEQ